MDPITHGIAGALIGKAFFSDRHGRAATFAATLGAVFPDVDVFSDVVSRDPLAIAKYHRGFTHSFIGLPFFAVALAGLTCWYLRRRGMPSPSVSVLAGIYAAGIASHILLDGLTSFGTRMWNPISSDRIAWDWLFIIDFTFTALLLVPQAVAWVHKRREGWAARATKMWALLSVAALGVWSLTRLTAYPFALRDVAIISAMLAAIFFLPGWNGWGARVGRAAWCRAGFVVALAYIGAGGLAHHAALARVKTFALQRNIAAENIGALPLPPSLGEWNGLILAPDGVYQAEFNLRDSGVPAFRFDADSAPNRFTKEAARLPSVRTYLWFARFPVVHFFAQDGTSTVEYSDLRFFGRGQEAPMPFTFEVVFDSAGKLLKQGWVLRGPRFLRRAIGPADIRP